MCKIAIRNAGLKQDDIARVLNVPQSVVSRPLKEHIESGSTTKRKRCTLILECKELLLKHYGTWRIIWRPPDTVKGGYWDFERSKVPGRNPGTWCWSPFDSLDCQNMVLRDDVARPHCTRIIEDRTSLVFQCRACCRTWTLSNTCRTSSADMKSGTSRIKTILNFARLYCMMVQDFMSWTHVPSEFNDENVPSYYSTMWRLNTT